jgi:hypothetical protein
MGRYEILKHKIETVDDLIDGFNKLPKYTKISPFGSSDCKLIYDKEEKKVYLDENFDFLEDFEE